MDIDSPPTDSYHPTHSHINLPSLSASFPLPFRVLFLLGFALLLWATNLHVLSRLGLDTSWILDFREDVEDIEMEESRDAEDTSPAKQLHNPRPAAASLYQPVYKLFLIYTAWVGGGWVVFRLLTRGETERMERYRALVGVIMGGVVVGLVVPSRRTGPRERQSFMRALKRIFMPPTTQPIHFADVILADILTSFAKVLGDLWVSACQIWNGGISEGRVGRHGWSAWVVLVMVCLPYLLRFRQCMLELHQSHYKSARPLLNAMKYATAFPVIFLSAAQKHVVSDIALQRGLSVQELGDTGDRWFGEHRLFRLWLLSVVVNSMFSFWWDVSRDWGLALLEVDTWIGKPASNAPALRHSIIDRLRIGRAHQRSPCPSPTPGSPVSLPPAGPWGLRPTILLPDASIYYLCTLIDLVLRLTWSLKLSSHLHTISEIESGVFMMEALELVRRWGWVFLRVEWEAVKMGEAARTTRHPSSSDEQRDPLLWPESVPVEDKV